MKFPLFFSVAICAAMPAIAQQTDINPKVQAYIDKYKDLAIQEQIRTGVPAAIKLAQGIHETAFGTSELCNNANNHFGIKCKSTWTGDSYSYDDDAKNECFRKYKNDYESYMDHSDFLKVNKRYANLFELDITDYKGWARGLKASGYATHPQYANLIINTVEKYNLNSYTLLAQNTKAIDYSKLNLVAQADNKFKVTKTEQPNSTTITATKTDINSGFAASNAPKSSAKAQSTSTKAINYYELTTKNGLKGFYVQQGDHLLGSAEKFNIRYSKLLKNNELADAPVTHDMFIYLDKKLDKGLISTYTVGDGETLTSVSQETGVSIDKIKYYNNLVDGVEPQVGSVLNLQQVSSHTPEVYIPSKYPASTNQIAKNQDRYANNQDNYIYNNERKTNNTAKAEEQPIAPKREPSFEQYKNKMGKPTETKATQETAKVTQAETTIAEKHTEQSNTLSPYDKLKMHMANSKDKKPEVDYSSYDYTPAAKTSNTTQTIAKEPVSTSTTMNVSSSNNGKYYIVKQGDTLFSIAKNNNVTVDELQRWNNVTPKTLTVGKKIQVKK